MLVWYIAKKAADKLKKFTGLWQHTTRGTVKAPKKTGREFSQFGVETGTTRLQLAGRDLPRRPARKNTDNSDELEHVGFLDQFPPHPLILPPTNTRAVQPDDLKRRGNKDA